MAGGLDAIAAWAFSDAISQGKADPTKESEATVMSTDGDGTTWVRLAGAEGSTPAIATSVTVSPGQTVRVRIEDGRARVIANASEPSVGGTYVQTVVEPVDRKAESAVRAAEIAHGAADAALESADAAQASATDAATAAANAQADATAAGTAAAAAQTSADAAGTAAAQAIADAATAQASADSAVADAATARTAAEGAVADAADAKAAATQAASDASSAASSASSAASSAASAATDASSASSSASSAASSAASAQADAATASANAARAVSDAAAAQDAALQATTDAADAKSAAQAANTAANGAVTGLATVQAVVDTLGTDVDDLQTHVAMMDAYSDGHGGTVPAGLHVVPTANGYFVVLSNDGMYVYDSQSNLVSTFGDSVSFSTDRDWHVGSSQAFIYYDESENTLQIGGANVTIGGKAPADLLTSLDVSVAQTATGADITVNGDTVHLANGATGATGPQGPQGVQGETGATGPQGETGPEAAVAIAPTAISWANGTATLQATLYVDGAEKTSGVAYSWTKDTSATAIGTNRTLNVTDLNAAYRCQCTW